MFKPNYQITNAILNNIASIEAAREIIENAPLVPYWEKQFREDRVVRTVHYSTSLEGNPLNIEEVRKVLHGESGEVKAYSRDIQEVINYRNVIKYIESTQRGTNCISEDDMNRIHELTVEKIVPETEVSAYRDRQWGTKNSTTGEISFVAPEPERVETLVQDFFRWVGSDEYVSTHPILRSGITLAEISRIHPYTEGNGRTSRAMATLSLYFDGYDIKRFFALDEYYDQNSEDYYRAIQTYQEDDDSLVPWLEFFVKGLDIELSRVKERVLKMSRDHKLREEIGQIALTDRQEEILNYIEKNRSIKNQDWRELFPDVSDDTILRDLKDMIDKGVIKKEGKTKAARYIIR
ncbi:Fic family protein [candidate division WWE3 bacterium]|uniref:Fic family protein n=1 Tax=candidate division WWE3 bacterium TaxID=2053526 RepID=A0A955LK08_UNCKA|nr:Fic family protein [candidate division WWE3 bacterium]